MTVATLWTSPYVGAVVAATLPDAKDGHPLPLPAAGWRKVA